MSDQRTDNLTIFFDTTLSDGGQTRSADLSAADKQFIALALNDFGIDYLKDGWLGANPTDDMFFSKDKKLKNAKLVAFGMTRRSERLVENNPGLNAFLDLQTDATCLVSKTWYFHVTTASNIELDVNTANR
tara:strand:- start:426 stop:818 length:393 start_codon:yes stop_codon:yes gene_type:complete